VRGGMIELEGSERPPAPGARRIGGLASATELSLTVTLQGPELPGTAALAGPPCTRAEVDDAYGASPIDVARIATTLTRFGLVPGASATAGRSLAVRGTAGAVRDAFGVTLAQYRGPDGTVYRGRQGPVCLPSELGGIVSGVFGLDERAMAHRDHTGSSRAPRAADSAPCAPEDLERRYQFPPSSAEGHTIAVAEFAHAPHIDDVQLFCQKHERRFPDLTVVPVGPLPVRRRRRSASCGAEDPDDRRLRVAATADIEMVASLCPGARIVVLVAPPTQQGWIDLLDRVVSGEGDRPVALAVAWGAAEGSVDWSAAARREIDVRLQLAAMLGITVCAAARAGAGPATGSPAHDHGWDPSFPGTSPFVVSVGHHAARAAAPDPDAAPWRTPGQDGAGETSFAASALFAPPSWQHGACPSAPLASAGRVVPDVAAVGPAPRVDVVVDGASTSRQSGGAAAVVWAALLTRIYGSLSAPCPPRFVAPLLYGGGSGPDVSAAGAPGATVAGAM